MSNFPGDLDDHDDVKGGDLICKKFFCERQKGRASVRPRRTFVVGLGELGSFDCPVASLIPRFSVETLRNSASEWMSMCMHAGVHEWAGTIRSKKKRFVKKNLPTATPLACRHAHAWCKS